MDDFVYTFKSFLTSLPTQTLHSPCLPTAVSHVLAALTCSGIGTIETCLDTLSHISELLHADPSASSAAASRYVPSIPGAANVIQPVFAQYGKGIFMILIESTVRDLPQTSLEAVQIILSTVSRCAPPAEVQEWVTQALGDLRGNVVGQADKVAFMREMQE